jgi:hypothetical protein
LIAYNNDIDHGPNIKRGFSLSTGDFAKRHLLHDFNERSNNPRMPFRAVTFFMLIAMSART